jgi:glutathione S-transferase
MSDIVIHGILGSPFVRSAQMACEEKSAPYRVAELAPGTLRGADYAKLHPFARVPTIEHGDYRLYETQAILRYIDAAFPEPSLQPRDPRAIGRMNQIIGINDWYFFPKVAGIVVFNRIVGPKMMGTTPDEAAIAAALPMGRICIDELGRLLGDQEFLVGGRLTIADLMLAPQLDFFQATPEGSDLLKDSPLAAWLTRMNARPSMQRTQRPAPFQSAA